MEHRFTPDMLFQSMKAYKVKIGLWVDLTNTDRFYNKNLVENNDCKYVKLSCRGHGETPSPDSVRAFVHICKNYIANNPMDIVGVHCTHGFNRTGFLITAFMIEEFDWSVDMAVNSFTAAREPGIYKESYLKDIYRRYSDGGEEDAPPAPELPDWCFEEDGLDDDGEPLESHSHTSNGDAGRKPKRGGKFMEGVAGVKLWTQQPKLSTIQKKVQRACDWTQNGFPGSQPVSMDRQNLSLLKKKPYKVKIQFMK